jgi:hypothetical protein
MIAGTAFDAAAVERQIDVERDAVMQLPRKARMGAGAAATGSPK